MISREEYAQRERVLAEAGYVVRCYDEEEPPISRQGKEMTEVFLLSQHELGSALTNELIDAGVPLIVLSNNPRSVQTELGARGNAENVWVAPSRLEGDDLLYFVARAVIQAELTRELEAVKASLGRVSGESLLVAAGPAMREVLQRAEAVASFDSTVLITGETGTGKTSLAHYIHSSSPRRRGPFISISCAAIPRELLEAELFGFERGAFTGALHSRIGAFEAAHGGTLFLDEIGELPLELQPKLLAVLQDRTVKRLGSHHAIPIDARIISATHRDLKHMCKERQFRDDLLFRLHVVGLFVPPLRERSEDIQPLFKRTLCKLCERFSIKEPRVSGRAWDYLRRYSWPGNVRELENLAERALILSGRSEISEAVIREQIADNTAPPVAPGLAGLPLREVEKRAIRETLELTKGDKPRAAALLGVSLKTLYNKIGRF